MADHSNYPVRLFSYGTLQLPSVQLATFGRRLDGVCDALCGLSLDLLFSMMEIRIAYQS